MESLARGFNSQPPLRLVTVCTIGLATRVFQDAPIVLGANREERYDRPAQAPARLETDPTVFGPMDLGAGGTWLGINENGLLVAVTNRPDGPDGTRSRGWLVRDALRCKTVEEGIRLVTDEVGRRSYTGFNLVLVSPVAARYVAWDGELQSRSLAAGVHVIVNDGIDDEIAKSATIRARLQAPAPESSHAWVDRVRTVLRDHGLGACVHGSEGGTRSSSIVVRRTDGHTTWRFADGPPCETPYRRYLEGEL